MLLLIKPTAEITNQLFKTVVFYFLQFHGLYSDISTYELWGGGRERNVWLVFNEPTMLTDSTAPVSIDGEIPQSFH